MRRIVPVILVVGALFVGYGCKGSSPTKPSSTSNFVGTFAALQGQSGTVAMSLQGVVASAILPLKLPFEATLHAQSSSATGNLSLIGGGTASLSGTYDSGSKALSLSGGGYSLSGTLSGSTITGSLTAAGSAGAFMTTSTSTGATTYYCSQQTTPTGEKVSFNVTVSSTGDIVGSFSVQPVGAGTVTGKLTGTNFTTTYFTKEGPFKGDTGVSTGTMANGVMNGIDKNGNPFSGSTAQCGTIAATIGGNPGVASLR